MWPESAYIRLLPVDEYIAPWAFLFDRQTQEVIGAPTPQTILILGAAHDYCTDFEPYTGELDKEDRPPDIVICL
jgi:hypothetical protein